MLDRPMVILIPFYMELSLASFPTTNKGKARINDIPYVFVVGSLEYAIRLFGGYVSNLIMAHWHGVV